MLDQIKRGDTQPLIELYKLHRDEFISWAERRYGINSDDAKDIFQESITIFYDKVRTGALSTMTSSVKTYIFAIGRNKILQLLNKLAQVGNVVSLDMIKEEIPDVMAEVLDEEKEFLDLLKNMLDKLPEKDRQVLTLHYFEGKSYQEIAQIMGYASPEVARKKKHFSLKKLMNEVKKNITILVL